MTETLPFASSRRRTASALAAAFLATLATSAQAELRLGGIFGDHMVLQRSEPVPVWGFDEPGTDVTVTLGEASVHVKAGDDGRFVAKLPALEAGGPHEVVVVGTSTVKLADVLVGEVWLCSGQSNMEWTVSGSANAAAAIAAANDSRIRHVKVPHRPAEKPEGDVKTGGWQPASPSTVGSFTAVGYFFGTHLAKELDVPIGLIGSNWGGTRIEPWTPPVGFEKTPALADITAKLAEYPSKNDKGQINHQSPLALYNGMIHPLLPYAIRGAIWYQGESNSSEGMLYCEKMKALIAGWRVVFEKTDLPFYFVGLAPYRYNGEREGHLPYLWEAQSATLAVAHTGMAVTVDIGDTKDIHPRNKQDVGKRLALCALAKTYGRQDVVWSGPVYRSMTIEEGKVRLRFDHVAGGLVARDRAALSWFSIAGEDRKFVDAKAEIDGDTVVVHSPEVAAPVAVRFGWSQLAEPNLSHRDGLPAAPFRTDRW